MSNRENTPAEAEPSRRERSSPVGRTLGEFVVKRKIGEGGFGAVYLADQPLLGREAVVKILHASALNNQELRQRFLREARLASAVDHPFAAHIYSFGAEPDGLMWLAMELVRGTPLSTWLSTRGPVPLHRFVPLFDKLCDVVHTLHGQGIIHRDINPANVMVLSRAGKMLPKLLDLGIAKVREVPSARGAIAAVTTPPPVLEQEAGDGAPDAPASKSSSERLVGSPPYMAPEQWTAPRSIDARTDVYALGVLAFEALIGRTPFQATTTRKLALAHLHDPAPGLGDGFPAAISAAIQRALAKGQDERYPDALAFSSALREAIGGAGDEPPSLPELDHDLREMLLQEAPQPLAEAIGALEAAHQPRQGLHALAQIARVSVRYLALVALAARARLGDQGLTKEVLGTLTALRQGTLSPAQWWSLTVELCRPFASCRDAHPMPELVDLCFEPDSDSPREHPELDPFVHEELVTGATEPSTERFRAALGATEAWLSRIAFVRDYPLAKLHEGAYERWTGMRRPHRPHLLPQGPTPQEGQLALVNAVGELVATLSPLVQAIAPTPGTAEEVFFLEGAGRYGAKLTALPQPFERHDEELWGWFKDNIADLEAGGQRRDEQEGAPYLGLSSFTTAQAKNFFGREREAEAFANRLRVHPLLAVVGPSGAGKSSFIQAGVIPLLPKNWQSITVRPGPSPLTAICERLSSLGLDGAALRRLLAADPAALGKSLRAYAQDRGLTLVLVVDQFEELVTLCPDVAERNLYAEALTRCSAKAADPVRVIVTLRDDFLIRVQALAALREPLPQGLQLLSTPASDDLMRIVTEPARRAGYGFDSPELPHEMVQAVQQQQSALALLSFTASRLWELRDRDRKALTKKAYQALGGVGGALAHHAEAVLDSMEDGARALVREAFRHLVTAEGTRAILTRRQAMELLGSTPQAEQTLETLISARLLTASEGPDGEDRIEVVHEALLVSWPRLVQWQKEDAENVRMRDQLRAAARQWEDRSRAKGLLWRGDALLEYRLWRSRYPGRLTQSEEAFVQASLRDEARGRTLRRGLLASSMIVLALGVILLSRAYRRANQASHEAAMRLAEFHAEQGRIAMLAGDVLRGLVYLSTAFSEGVENAGLRFMLGQGMRAMDGTVAILKAGEASVSEVTITPDGQTAITAGDDGYAHIWRIRDGTLLATVKGGGGPVRGLALSPDGQRFAMGNVDGQVGLWRITGEPIAEVMGHPGTNVMTVRFSPDGSLYASVALDSTLRLWDGHTGRPAGVMHTATGEGVISFSPRGDLVAVAPGPMYSSGNLPADPAAEVWDVRRGKRLWRLRGQNGYAQDVTFSPDGLRIATSGTDRFAHIWDARTGTELHRLQGHTDDIRSVAFSPDGRALATASMDGTARVWSVADGALLWSFRGHGSPMLLVRFGPTGRRVLTAEKDGALRLWGAETGRLQWVYLGHTDAIVAMTFAPDGRQLLSGSIDHTARVWRTDVTLEEWATGDSGSKAWVELSQRGPYMLSGSPDGEFTLSNWKTKETLSRWKIPGPIRDFAWSPDETLLAADQGSAVWVWRLPELSVIARLDGDTQKIESIQFSPEGRRLLTTSTDGLVKLWQVPEGSPLLALNVGTLSSQARFSPDGRRLLVSGYPSNLSLWDASTGQRLRQWYAHNFGIFPANFSPDGHFILSGGQDFTLAAWDGHTGELVAKLPAQTDMFAWTSFSPDSRYALSTSVDGLVRVWDTSSWAMVGELRVAAGTVFAGFDPSGEHIITGGSPRQPTTVWFAHAFSGTARESAQFVRCHVPYRVTGKQLVATQLPTDCPTDPSSTPPPK